MRETGNAITIRVAKMWLRMVTRSSSKMSHLTSESSFKTEDQHELTLTAKFADYDDLSVTFDTRLPDQERMGERVKSFDGIVVLAYQNDDGVLIFHKDDPENSPALEQAVFAVPATVVDAFWLRQDESLRQILIEAAFEDELSTDACAKLQPQLDKFAALASKCFAAINLEEISDTKSAGLLKRKPLQYHVNYKALDELFRKELIGRVNPTLKQVLYCLGRLHQSMTPEWETAIEEYGTPETISQSDKDSEKWKARYDSLKKTGVFEFDDNVNWRYINQITNDGKLLNRFIEKIVESPKYGLEALKGQLGILTSDSTATEWKIASLTRLLHYFLATKNR